MADAIPLIRHAAHDTFSREREKGGRLLARHAQP